MNDKVKMASLNMTLKDKEEKMKLILVRHGQTDWNVQKRFCGHSDIPVNALGEKQIYRAADVLKDQKISRVFTSDLKRAVQTAEAVMTYHECEIEKKQELREMFFGKWEGMTYQEILQTYPEHAEPWIKDYLNVPCLEGESLLNFYNRINEAVDLIKKETPKENTVLIAAHAGVIQSILSKEILGTHDGYWKFRVDNGGIAIIEYDKKFPILTALNI